MGELILTVCAGCIAISIVFVLAAWSSDLGVTSHENMVSVCMEATNKTRIECKWELTR